ncbi:MAG: hypothetical protein M3P85_07360 [Actinomycetota bacterium]|nr:hypothetical protein [Actinomycetota bacterium]
MTIRPQPFSEPKRRWYTPEQVGEFLVYVAGLREKSPLPYGLVDALVDTGGRVPVEVVATRLGNTPRVVQEVYAHVIPADDQAAAQLVGDLYRKAGS